MSYSLDVFTTWASYGSWDALKAWLQSRDGGSLRTVEPRDSDLVLIRYTKGVSDFNKAHVRWCRSVVFNKTTLRVVSVAPPKASELSDTFDTSNYTVAEEFVDGTMVNIFSDSTLGCVDVATRSRLGGNNQFYANGPTFRSMLDDALSEDGASLVDLLPVLTENNQNRFTSIVLQHPQNRVVKSVSNPAYFVIHKGSVLSDGTIRIVEMEGDFFPRKTSVPQYNLSAVLAVPTLRQWVVQQSQESGYEWQGLVLKDGEGNRWRVRSEVYETVRRLRGNESLPEERFARLRKMRTLDQYLNFFPEDRQTLYQLEGVFRENTRRLHGFYVSTFITRKSQYHDLPWPFKYHVSVLHNLYKDMLKPHGKKMTMEEVVRYANRLDAKDTTNLAKKATVLTVLAVPAASPSILENSLLVDALPVDALPVDALPVEVLSVDAPSVDVGA